MEQVNSDANIFLYNLENLQTGTRMALIEITTNAAQCAEFSEVTYS